MTQPRDPYPGDPGPKGLYTPRKRYVRGLYIPQKPAFVHAQRILFKPGDPVLLNHERAQEYVGLIERLEHQSPPYVTAKRSEIRERTQAVDTKKMAEQKQPQRTHRRRRK